MTGRPERSLAVFSAKQAEEPAFWGLDSRSEISGLRADLFGDD
jgi:hypothetical protein